MRRAARLAMRLAWACSISVGIVGGGHVAASPTSVCPNAASADARPLYLPAGVGGLVRLELSPGVPGGLGMVPVARDEVARLCIEGFDVRPLDVDALPNALSIVRRGARVYGNLWNAAARPIGVRTQWLRFRIEMAGYVGQGEHVPVALFADVRALVATPAAIIGNGIVIGEVYLAPNGCGGVTFPSVPVANSEVEAFWRGGNALWGESCGDVALADGHGYGFLVAADADGAVRYENDVDVRMVSPPTIDTSARRPPFDPAIGGILIASTNFCSPCADFEIHFTQIASGWSKLAVGDARVGKSDTLVPDVAVLAFPAQEVGTQGAAQRVVFTNTGSDVAHPTFAITADDGPHCGDPALASACASELALSHQSFSVDASGCESVAVGNACAVLVTFAPRGAFATRAKLGYGDAAGAGVRSIALEGFGVPSPVDADKTVAIEYFHAGLGHYFVTALPTEQAVLDTGTIGGWKRTGEWFGAYRAGRGSSAGAKPVCRYYGRPEAGLDSHFYSASILECDAVAQRFPQAWILESNDLFDIDLPDPASGACADGRPVYRLWNARASSNHRYTTDRTTRAAMIASGWIPEGYGRDGVAMCDASR
jgi:hypothetical protein